MILVTGATGNVGGELIARLCEAGVPTRALVRTPEKADALRGYDCEVAVGDYSDRDSLTDALRGVETVFLVTPDGPGQVRQERSVIDAVVRAGGARIIKQAVMGPAAVGRMGDNHAGALDYLRSSGLPHTVLAPNSFMQNLLRSAALVQEQNKLAVPAGNGALSCVDARDVAAVAAHVVTTEGHEGATYEITGPEALTFGEMAVRMSRVLGRDISYVDVAPHEFRATIVDSGMSEWLADALGDLMSAIRAGKAAAVTDEVKKATGRPARPIEDFLATHRMAFA